MNWTRVTASNAIDEAAAAWVARLDRGLGGEEQAALDAWLATDSRHRGALLRAQAVFASFDRTRALAPAETFDARRRSRRWLLGGVGTALAASVAGVAGVGLWSRDERREHATRPGEIRSIALADGSVATLDAASRIAVTFTARSRNVTLIAGRALFDVARDPTRPFVVDAGTLAIRAIGTSFSVERDGDAAVEVMMREGLAQISGGNGLVARLGARDRLALVDGRVTRRAIDAQAVERALGWRSGMLDFADRPLAEAAASFARYGGTPIVVAPEVAQRRITGRFAASDPRGFASAAATSLGIRAEIGRDQVILTR